MAFPVPLPKYLFVINKAVFRCHLICQRVILFTCRLKHILSLTESPIDTRKVVLIFETTFICNTIYSTVLILSVHIFIILLQMRIGISPSLTTDKAIHTSIPINTTFSTLSSLSFSSTSGMTMENFVLENTWCLNELVSISSTVLPRPLGYLRQKGTQHVSSYSTH